MIQFNRNPVVMSPDGTTSYLITLLVSAIYDTTRLSSWLYRVSVLSLIHDDNKDVFSFVKK